MRIIILDAGHGGHDSGACGNGLAEKYINLETTMSIKKTLEENGYRVFLTRDNDTFVSLGDRVSFANRIYENNRGSEVVFISLHHNAGGGDRGEYIHSIHGGVGKQLAEAIGEEMLNVLGQQKSVYYKESNTSKGKDYYYVIRHTSMPAIIVEVAFIDNSNDVEICNTLEKRIRNGQVIANGIMKYFGGNIAPIKDVGNTNMVASNEGSSNDCSIATLQNELNVQGFTDYNGNTLDVDNIVGSKTISAASKTLLKNGTRGNITRWLQSKLISLGYNLGPDGADGVFGNNTHNAVVSFQNDNGLVADGIVGNNTWSCILNK